MSKKDNPDAKGTPHPPQGEGKKAMNEPDWADNLRNMYDKVVDEPIPDSFKDLLAQFDDPKKPDGDKA